MRPVKLFIASLLLATAPATAFAQTGTEQDLQIADVEVLRRTVDEIRTNLLRRGERVAAWDRGGDNPDAELRARGTDRFYFLNRSDEGTSVGIITNRSFADFAPSSWRIVDSYGSSRENLPSPQLDFIAVSARYVIGTRTQFTRRGDVDCTPGTSSALLYEVPDAPASPNDETVPMMFRLLNLAMEGQEVCVRSDGDGTRGYRSRVFLPDGTELPELTDDGVTTIVPAAPIDRLIVPPPVRTEASPSG